METPLFEPRTVGQIFRTTFALYRRHFWHFIAISAVVGLPLALLSASSSAVKAKEIAARHIADSVPGMERTSRESVSSGGSGPTGETRRDAWSVRFLLTGFRIGIGTFGFGALMTSLSALYADRRVTALQAYRLVCPKLLSLACGGVLTTLLVSLGLCILILPGIFFLLWYALTLPCIVAEDLGPVRAMQRSRALARGRMRKLFGVVLVVNLIQFGVAMPFHHGVYYAVKAILGANPPLTWFVATLVSGLCLICLHPIGGIALVLLYWRIRRCEDRSDDGLMPEEMRIRS